MPAPVEQDDKSFLGSLAEMLGIDEDAAREKVEALDGASLIDLSDAVFRKDESAVQQIMGGAGTGTADEDVEDEKGLDDVDGFDGEMGDLLLPDDNDSDDGDEEDEPEDEDEGLDYDDEEPVIEDATDARGALAIGDRVRVGNSRGVVHIPDGPGSTVGVVMQGKLRMVDRSQIVRESIVGGSGIMGMAKVPEITRMQQLAGIMLTTPSASPPPQPAFPAETTVTPVGDCEGDPASKAAMAISDLETALPELKLGDWKTVRQRLQDMMQKINERHEQQVRRRKL